MQFSVFDSHSFSANQQLSVCASSDTPNNSDLNPISKQRMHVSDTTDEGSGTLCTPLVLLKEYREDMMGVAALWVWMFHTWKCVATKSLLFGWMEIFLYRLGYYGVDIFFLLSGTSLMFSNINNIRGFYFKERFIRVYKSDTRFSNWYDIWILYSNRMPIIFKNTLDNNAIVLLIR